MNSFNVYITSFGAPYADATASKGADVQPYKYNGKELDLMHGLNTYDYGARQHDPILARWDRIDPLCEKYYNVSPYNYCLNNPVKFIDPNGKATYVIDNGNGTYTTIGKGVLNKDRNIYICTLDKKGNISKIGESIGQSLTTRYFVNSKDEFVKGAIINPNDKSGQSFLKKMENTGLYDYMWNATGGKPYDFKKTNGTEKVIGESTEYVYRGMKINTRGKGEVYASARDVGNYAAGMVAGKEQISYQAARLAFDTLESAQKRELTTEGANTQEAEKEGWTDYYNHKAAHELLQNMLW